jgi:predicted ABC-type transport system involved in lysophospholipase L1 biosynthesis ATPase subunit
MLQIEMCRLDTRSYPAQARSLLEQVGLGGFVSSYTRERSSGMTQQATMGRALLAVTKAHDTLTKISPARGVLRRRPSPISPSMQE